MDAARAGTLLQKRLCLRVVDAQPEPTQIRDHDCCRQRVTVDSLSISCPQALHAGRACALAPRDAPPSPLTPRLWTPACQRANRSAPINGGRARELARWIEFGTGT